jgi:hypothetical protein
LPKWRGVEADSLEEGDHEDLLAVASSLYGREEEEAR